MNPVDSKQALRISLGWEAENLSLEIPGWTSSIEKHFKEFNPQIEHYLDEKNPKCLTKVSWDLASGPRESEGPLLLGTRAVYWLFFSNDGRLGCRFWGGVSAPFGVGSEKVGYAIQAAGSQRLRNKSGDWLKHLNKPHEVLGTALYESHAMLLDCRDAFWALRNHVGQRSWNIAASELESLASCSLLHLLTVCSDAINTGFYTPWQRPAQWAAAWSVLRGLGLATQKTA